MIFRSAAIWNRATYSSQNDRHSMATMNSTSRPITTVGMASTQASQPGSFRARPTAPPTTTNPPSTISASPAQ